METGQREGEGYGGTETERVMERDGPMDGSEIEERMFMFSA